MDQSGWPVRHRSREGLVQPQSGAVVQDRDGSGVNIKIAWGPNAAKFDAVVTRKIHNRRVEDMRAKLTDDQRRNLCVAVFGPYFVR